MKLRYLIAPLFISCAFAGPSPCGAADIALLSEQTWEEFAPHGKEVDCIYGDYVLRNESIVVVIAQPLPTRNANMTVRGVGGMIIDLTKRDAQNDQLSAYYAGGGKYQFHSPKNVKVTIDSAGDLTLSSGKASGKKIAWECAAETAKGKPAATLRYSLSDGEPFIVVETIFANPTDMAVGDDLTDAIRADRTFTLVAHSPLKLFQADDEWFRQSYGVLFDDREPVLPDGKGNLMQLRKDGASKVSIEPGKEVVVRRRIFPGDSALEVRGLATSLTGVAVKPVSVLVEDSAGRVTHARVTLTEGGKVYAAGRTDKDGKLSFLAPVVTGSLTAEATGRPMTKGIPVVVTNDVSKVECKLGMQAAGYVQGSITDAGGKQIPCKVAFYGKAPTPDPDFGPESGQTAVKNLVYSVSGKFTQAILPGKYEAVVSYGPEYDIAVVELEVTADKPAVLAAKLVRTVNTAGWISSDFHSHSSPSGDNTSSQFGRVENLLCEHIEFGPCTEHNRIDTYAPHLKALRAEHLMATCTGMELTGGPLPVNHQNVFPLLYKPRTQDGGGPVTDQNPVLQIERLAMWDNKSDKLLQMNHPNLPQILGDKDLDGKPDGGFEKMLGFVDVVEIHPPHTIFTPPQKDAAGNVVRNTIFNWLQMLNLGYRIPGVINTDAHYNFHGSGGFRNYIKSSTDDPAQVDTMEMVHNSEKGHLIVSTGPFLEVGLTAVGEKGSKKKTFIPGENMPLPMGKCELQVRVQCPNWLDVNRVQVFLNGRPEKTLNFTRRTTPERFQNDVVKFDATLSLELKEDTHVIVATIGEEGRVGRVMGPQWGMLPPTAVSNPIFVDVDGGGFKANGDLLDVPLPLK